MYILADLEWANTKEDLPYPTQIALMRVDAAWREVETFFSRVKPIEDKPDWRHCGFTGGKAEEFRNADDSCAVVARMQSWLQPDDVICWWFGQAKKMFRKFFAPLAEHKTVVLSEYMPEHLQEPGPFRQNPYKFAKDLLTRDLLAQCSQGEEEGAQLPSPEHQSANDAEVMRMVLFSVQFPQARLSAPPKRISKKPKPGTPAYIYDYGTKRLHVKGCELIAPTAEQEKYETLKRPIQKGRMPCKCCAAQYYRALAERNRGILNRCQYTYVYTPDSAVFHRYTCKAILTAHGILGTGKYQSCIEGGRRPCRRCNPSPLDMPRPVIQPGVQTAAKEKAAPSGQNLPKEAQRALNRLHQAQQERFSPKGAEGMTSEERRDFMTLTQPGYVFWAARGYQNFHQRTCSRLKGLTSLTGFSHFNDAVRAGYTPCKHCKPTKKMDAVYSIPIGSKARTGESYKLLEELCEKYNYPYSLDRAGTFFSLETPVGKWRINLSSRLISLQHINLVSPWGSKTDYHQQPRLFLSLLDTFEYIHRHDTVLQQRQNGG